MGHVPTLLQYCLYVWYGICIVFQKSSACSHAASSLTSWHHGDLYSLLLALRLCRQYVHASKPASNNTGPMLAKWHCRGGLRFGALAGLFYAVQQISSIARAERGLPDTVAGGTAAGAVFGATGVSLCSICKSQHCDRARLQMPEIISLHFLGARLFLDSFSSVETFISALVAMPTHAQPAQLTECAFVTFAHCLPVASILFSVHI